MAPLTIEIDPADGFCNFRCGHCCFNSYSQSNPTFINSKRLAEVLADAKSLGARAVEFVGGGEPTTHPEIALLVETAHKLGYEIGFVTNGYLLERIFSVARYCTYVRISLDAGYPETFAKVHGVDGFDEVLENIGRLGSYMPSRDIGLSFLISAYNPTLKEMDRAVNIVRELGLGYIVFKPAHLERPLPKEFWQVVLENIKKLKSRYPGVNVYGGFEFPSRWKYLSNKRDYGSFCWVKPLNCVIMANGDIPLCFLYRRHKDKTIGNIYSDDFRDIWFGSRHLEMWKSQRVETCPYPCKFDGPNRIVSSIARGVALSVCTGTVKHSNFF